MKICMAGFAYAPHTLGGAVVYTERIARTFCALGHDVSVLTINPGRGSIDERDGRVAVHRFHPWNVSTFHHVGRQSVPIQAFWTLCDIYSPFARRACRRFLARERPDVVHLHTPIDLTLAVFDACRGLGIPVVMTLHEYLLLCRRNIRVHGDGSLCREDTVHPACRAYRRFSRAASRAARAVIAPSRHVLDAFSREGFFPESVRHVLAYGIPLTDRPPERDFAGNEFNVLYCGSLTRHKGVQVLIRAFRKIADPRLRLTLVGEGGYRPQLEREAAGDRRISFYGPESAGDMHRHYAQAHLLVVPSVWEEALGIVILEAFDAGLPVAASRIGGIPEVVVEGYNGRLFEAGDEEQLRMLIGELSHAPQKMQELGRNARECSRAYGLEPHCARLLGIYEGVIGNTGTVNPVCGRLP